MGLTDLPRRIAVDTAIFIYFVEGHERFRPLIRSLFVDADTGKRTIVTSAITLLEVLVRPYREKNVFLTTEYEELLTNSRGVRLVDLSQEQLHAAARIRAVTGAKTPDALQLAAAVSTGCRAFLTNDVRMPSLPGVKAVNLEMLSRSGLHEG